MRSYSFLVAHMAFDDAAYDMDEVIAFWRAVGISADMLHIVAYVNPWWHTGHLWANGKLHIDLAAMETVRAVILYLFRWRKFVDRRFCMIGASCRAIVCSSRVGLDRLVTMTRSDPTPTGYHLHS